MKLVNSQLIKKWEALRLKAYLPTPNDRWTIGWGHTQGVTPGMVITEAEAEQFFRQDVAWAEDAVNQLVTVDLNQNQFDALVSFTFNLGRGQFASSTLLRKLNSGDYEGAAREFDRWVYQDGVVLRGLVKRRKEERAYFQAQPKSPVNISEGEPVGEMKNLGKSKEILGGVFASVTGAAGAFSGLDSSVQQQVANYLPYIVIGVGIFFIANRLYARYKLKR